MKQGNSKTQGSGKGRDLSAGAVWCTIKGTALLMKHGQ